MNRDKEIIEMRSKGFSLQEIGDKYGITRERVRQIVGNTGRKFLTEHYAKSVASIVSENVKHEDSQKIKNKRLATAFKKAISKIHHKISGGESNAKFGEMCESEVSRILAENGIENKLMPYGHSFDIEANGYRIDVKSSKEPRVFGDTKATFYQFSVKKDVKKNFCDFFVFYCYDKKHIYVIPYSDVPEVRSLYIRGEGHSRRWGKSNVMELERYKDRFDLLK